MKPALFGYSGIVSWSGEKPRVRDIAATYHALAGSFFDLVHLDFGKALDLEQDLRHGAIDGL